jgi:hypothetical protein
MPNVYVEARPKGRPEGSSIEDFVVEDHADHVLGTFKTKKRSTGSERTAIRPSRACGISTTRKYPTFGAPPSALAR